MAFALIENRQVVEISDNKFEVSPPLAWMKAPKGCQAGWFVKGGKLMPPRVATLSEVKEAALETIKQAEADFLTKATGNATQQEINTWSLKAIAARAYLEGIATDDQKELIEFGGNGKGVIATQYAQKIIHKAKFYNKFIGVADRLKLQAKQTISSAESVDDVNAILASFAQQAESKFKELTQ